MTNAQLIMAACALYGITEDAHTYAHWRVLGYQVRKGEHAAFQTTIWKHVGGKPANEEEADGEATPGRMFLKKASFFTRSQVDPITAMA